MGPVLATLAFLVPAQLSLRAERADTAISVDGRLDEAAWRRAAVVTELTQNQPDEGKPGANPTEIRVLFDDESLYFGFVCLDDHPVTAQLTRRDGNLIADAIGFEIDTRGDARAAFHFEVSAGNVQRDAIRTGDDAYTFDWDAVWTSAVDVDEKGYVVEARIPLTALRFEPGGEKSFKLQLIRFTFRTNEFAFWAFKRRDEHGELARFKPLEGVEGLVPPRGITLRPFAVLQARGRSAPDGVDAVRGWSGLPSVGLDARYGITTGLSLDATVLPDFGQVEQDPALLNLSNFELFFPERRPFFLEGTELYALHNSYGNDLDVQPFYSRRMGAKTNLSLDGADVYEQPSSTRVWGAAKLSGRIGDSLSVAVLEGVTAAEQAVIRQYDGSLGTVQAGPLSNYAMARLTYALPYNVTIGATLTDVHRFEPADSQLYLGNCVNTGEAPTDTGRCFRDATSAAVDVNFTAPESALQASLHVLGSRIHEGPTLTLRDGTSIGAGDTGWGVRAEVVRRTGVLFGEALFETYSPKLELNDMGYLRTQNLIRFFGQGGLQFFSVGPWQENRTGVQIFGRNAFDGTVITRGINLDNWAFWNNFFITYVRGEWTPRTYDNRETGDGLRTEKEVLWAFNYYFSTNAQKPLYADTGAYIANRWKGASFDGFVGLGARPFDRLQLALAPQLTVVKGDPRWVDTFGNTYRFGLQDVLATGATLRSTLTFTPRMTLELYAQLFFAHVTYSQLYETEPDGRYLLLDHLTPVSADPRIYDDRNVALNINAVFRWEFLPGSVLYLVYTHAQGGAPAYETDAEHPRIDFGALGRVPAEDVFLVKASYYFAR